MGQKVHPYGFRIGYNRTWHSRWYAEKDYLKFLHDDIKLREELKRDLAIAAVGILFLFCAYTYWPDIFYP